MWYSHSPNKSNLKDEVVSLVRGELGYTRTMELDKLHPEIDIPKHDLRSLVGATLFRTGYDQEFGKTALLTISFAPRENTDKINHSDMDLATWNTSTWVSVRQ